MKSFELVGVVLLVLGALIVAFYGLYQLAIIEEIPLVIKAALALFGLGLLIIMLSLVRERMSDIKKERKGTKK